MFITKQYKNSFVIILEHPISFNTSTVLNVCQNVFLFFTISKNLNSMNILPIILLVEVNLRPNNFSEVTKSLTETNLLEISQIFILPPFRRTLGLTPSRMKSATLVMHEWQTEYHHIDWRGWQRYISYITWNDLIIILQLPSQMMNSMWDTAC